MSALPPTDQPLAGGAPASASTKRKRPADKSDGGGPDRPAKRVCFQYGEHLEGPLGGAIDGELQRLASGDDGDYPADDPHA